MVKAQAVLERFRLAAARWVRGLGQVQLAEARCISLRGGESVMLFREFLGSASEVRMEFIAHWPASAFVQCRLLRVRLLDGAGVPMEEVEGCRLEQTVQGRVNRVQFTLPARVAAKEQRIRLEIRTQTRGRLVGTLEFCALDSAQTQSLLLQNLAVEHGRLWVINAGRRYPCERVPCTSEAIVPEFTLRCNRLAPFLPNWSTDLVYHLHIGEKKRVPLGKTALSLSDKPQPLRGPLVPVRDNRLVSAAGAYALVASLAGQPIAELPFQVLGETELLGHVKLARIHLNAETRTGDLVRGVRILRTQEHRAIHVSLQLQIGIPAPNTSFNCTVQLLKDREVLAREEIEFHLDQALLDFRLPRIDLSTLAYPANARRVRLRVTVSINGVQQGVAAMVLLPAQSVSNFEGQLKLDSRDLAVDDAEYHRILRQLGVANPEPARRKFWRLQP